MLRILERKPSLGIEITGSEMRLAGLSTAGGNVTMTFSTTTPLSPGLASTAFGSSTGPDVNGLAGLLRESLSRAGRQFQRAALSLPDGLFRMQTLDFDELPSRPSERDRLIRWRLEKAAAYDLSGTSLRFQVLKRGANGYTVLVCVARQAVVEQYEQVLLEAGLEPWRVGPSSLYILNLYLPLLSGKTPVFALAHLTEDSFALIVLEQGGTRFYRFKEVKRGGANDIKTRFEREIEDSLHFYSHMDRTQTSELKHLYLSGESDLPRDLVEGLSAATALGVEVLSPADAISVAAQCGSALPLAAALGAGRAL